MKKADVWAMGITLYIFTYNRFPYEFRSNTDGNCMTEIDIMESISNFHLNFPENGRKVSDDLKALLAMMLDRDPARRPEISEIKTVSRFLND
jgi:serine/threonine protein kinase